jgi:hypothetical protein
MALLVLLSIMLICKAQSLCKPYLYKKDFESWRDLGSGLIAGFFVTPPEDEFGCPVCTSFGNNLGNL